MTINHYHIKYHSTFSTNTSKHRNTEVKPEPTASDYCLPNITSTTVWHRCLWSSEVWHHSNSETHVKNRSATQWVSVRFWWRRSRLPNPHIWLSSVEFCWFKLVTQVLLNNCLDETVYCDFERCGRKPPVWLAVQNMSFGILCKTTTG